MYLQKTHTNMDIQKLPYIVHMCCNISAKSSICYKQTLSDNDTTNKIYIITKYIVTKYYPIIFAQQNVIPNLNWPESE